MTGHRRRIKALALLGGVAISASWLSAPPALAQTIDNVSIVAEVPTTPTPTMEAGMVAVIGDGAAANGATVLGESVFTGSGTQVMKTDKNTGETVALAGSATISAQKDAIAGAKATFYSAVKVIGNDGSLVYVQDGNKVRTVDPITGATATTLAPQYSQYAIGGHYLYGLVTFSYSHTVVRFDLTTGVQTTLFTGGDYLGAGSLAADNDRLWYVASGTLTTFDLAGTRIAVAALPFPTRNAVSSGAYLYVATDSDRVARISKADGATRFIAGDAAHDDPLLQSINGIAADANTLYVSGSNGLSSITAAYRTYASAAAGPRLHTGSVTTIQPLPTNASGLTVLEGYVYTGSGSQILKSDKRTGTTVVLAGNDTVSVRKDATTGNAATFSSGVKIIGNDGTLLYAQDGDKVRTVNPRTGATRTTLAPRADQYAVGGHYLYGIVNLSYSYVLSRYDLRSGAKTTLVNSKPGAGSLAADETHVWFQEGTALMSVNLAGHVTVLNAQLPTLANGTAAIENNTMLVVGDFLYTKARQRADAAGNPQPAYLARIDKVTGAVGRVVTEDIEGALVSMWGTGKPEISTDGTDIFALDRSSASTKLLRVRPQAPRTQIEPREAADWWRGLNPAQRLSASDDHPERIGWLDGIPVTDRDRANWIMLFREETRLTVLLTELTARLTYIQTKMDQGLLADLYPNTTDPVTAAEAELLTKGELWKDTDQKLKGIGDLQTAFGASGGTAVPQPGRSCVGVESTSSCYLVGFSTQVSGRVIVSVGNPDLADNVASLVPGTFAGLNDDVETGILRVGHMAKDAENRSSRTTAALLWQGYDPPQSLPMAARSIYSENGAPLLRRFLEGLRVAHHDGRASATVMGHSYGTVVVGRAASGSINADRIVFVASPGTTVINADDLHLVGYSTSRGRVWATTASNDPISLSANLVHGHNPVRPDYKSRVFDSAPGDSEPHSEYWDEGNPSRASFALINVGLADCSSAGSSGDGAVDYGDVWDPSGESCKVEFS